MVTAPALGPSQCQPWRCDRVTWCLGPFSLVITYISLSWSFPVFISQEYQHFPPFVGFAQTRKVAPFHCGDGGGFDTPTRPNCKLKPPTNTANRLKKSRETINSKSNQPQSKLHPFTWRHYFPRLLL